MYVVGLTGGTGAGKSTAARRFETHGIAVVDADKIGHALIAPGGAAVEDVVSAFGEGIVTCGNIDRKALGARVFSDPAALATLNGIMQPRIALAIGEACAAFADVGRTVTIVDAALLGDNGTLEPWLAGLILVASSQERRVARLVAGRGLDKELAWERVRAQVDPELKRPLARWVIENDSTLDTFCEQVDRVAKALLALGRSSNHAAL